MFKEYKPRFWDELGPRAGLGSLQPGSGEQRMSALLGLVRSDHYPQIAKVGEQPIPIYIDWVSNFEIQCEERGRGGHTNAAPLISCLWSGSGPVAQHYYHCVTISTHTSAYTLYIRTYGTFGFGIEIPTNLGLLETSPVLLSILTSIGQEARNWLQVGNQCIYPSYLLLFKEISIICSISKLPHSWFTKVLLVLQHLLIL